MSRRGRRFCLIACGAVLLLLAGFFALHRDMREMTLSDALGVETADLTAASLCDANDCMNTEVSLSAEQLENVMQLFSQTKIKKVRANGTIQSAYARCFFETEKQRYEVLLAPDHILVNLLNDDDQWCVYSIVSPDDGLEKYIKGLL